MRVPKPKPQPAKRIVDVVSAAVGRADIIGDRVVLMTREETAEILRAAGELVQAEASA